MKKILIAIFLLIPLFFLTTCDVIENPIKENTGNFIWNGRKILIYDFTAHQCINCPDGHETIEELKKVYGDSLISVVSIHCTSMAEPLPPEAKRFPYDFRTDIGNELGGGGSEQAGYYGTLSLPSGLVNSLASEKISVPSSWAVETQKIISSFPEFTIKNSSSFTEDSTISCNIKITANFETTRKLKLITFLTEDNIINHQQTHQGVNKEYVHNNVLRAGFNGTWGESLKDNNSTIYPESLYEKSYSISAKSHDWKIENCKIVSFVYDTETFEILQAEETKVKLN